MEMSFQSRMETLVELYKQIQKNSNFHKLKM